MEKKRILTLALLLAAGIAQSQMTGIGTISTRQYAGRHRLLCTDDATGRLRYDKSQELTKIPAQMMLEDWINYETVTNGSLVITQSTECNLYRSSAGSLFLASQTVKWWLSDGTFKTNRWVFNEDSIPIYGTFGSGTGLGVCSYAIGGSRYFSVTLLDVQTTWKTNATDTNLPRNASCYVGYMFKESKYGAYYTPVEATIYPGTNVIVRMPSPLMRPWLGPYIQLCYPFLPGAICPPNSWTSVPVPPLDRDGSFSSVRVAPNGIVHGTLAGIPLMPHTVWMTERFPITNVEAVAFGVMAAQDGSVSFTVTNQPTRGAFYLATPE